MINSTFIWLVVWLPCFIYPLILGIIIPIDFHIFQRGGPTTNQLWFFFTNHEQPELHLSEKSFVAVAVVVESWSLVVVSVMIFFHQPWTARASPKRKIICCCCCCSRELIVGCCVVVVSWLLFLGFCLFFVVVLLFPAPPSSSYYYFYYYCC